MNLAAAASLWASMALTDVVDDLMPGNWATIPNTHMRDVCPADTSAYSFRFYCRNVVRAWSGATLDTTRGRLLVWGGGHMDYRGNEVYAFDLGDLRWMRLTDPTAAAQIPTGSGTTTSTCCACRPARVGPCQTPGSVAERAVVAAAAAVRRVAATRRAEAARAEAARAEAAPAEVEVRVASLPVGAAVRSRLRVVPAELARAKGWPRSGLRHWWRGRGAAVLPASSGSA